MRLLYSITAWRAGRLVTKTLGIWDSVFRCRKKGAAHTDSEEPITGSVNDGKARQVT
jgi:hypothetical protein